MSPNRLAGEKSPYLLQHADNPVDWHPWGEEAFVQAKQENKPILLSIGYSTCHWCHVMEEESFRNPRIAELINKHFVSIKVDREERPDLDEVYMKAVQLMTGQGGWPLTVFLTPDLKPFYGGTYFPDKRRGGMPGFDEILTSVSDAWKNRKQELLQSSSQVASALQQMYSTKQFADTLSLNPLEAAYDALVSMYDEAYGGFGQPPKFPMPTYIFFLNRISWKLKDRVPLRMATSTLTKIERGGIHDHVGGGFHRYSTDRYWLVPHFEKMLYDNALLAQAYLEAYLLTGETHFKQTGLETLDWMLREMRGPEGGFYTAVDADTSEGEGTYYAWTKKEVIELLGERDGEVICKLFGITTEGNFEDGQSLLSISREPQALASEYSLTLDEIELLIKEARRRMLTRRNERPKPAVDDKVLASINGLAISALSHGYQVSREVKYLEAAKEAAGFILTALVRDGYLLRRYRDGEAAIDATLEDYAFMTRGLLDLFESCFEPRWFKSALDLTDRMVELFEDHEAGGFFFVSNPTSGLPRIKEAYDAVTPSGNSVAAMNLIRFYEFTGEARFAEKAEKIFRAFWDRVEQDPAAHTHLLCALDYYLSPRREVVVVGPKGKLEQFIQPVHAKYMPNRVIVGHDPDTQHDLPSLIPLLKEKKMLDESVTAYVCEGFACRLPTTSLEEFLRQIQ